ncbi:MAG: TRAP transporter small permease [Pseudomonadota bacterium]
MSRAEKIVSLVTFVARLGTGISFTVLLVAVLVQIIGRLTDTAPVWTEELTRFALLFTVAFGAGLSLRTGDLVNVDVICEALPGKAPWALRLFAAIATAALALFLLPQAWRYVSIGKMQTSPALGVRMDFIHASVWLMLIFLTIFALLRIFGMLTGAENGLPSKPIEQE